MKPYTIAIAGSTEHTVICAEVLRENPEFQVLWTLTPTPKPIGRTQTLTENPLHLWSQKNQIQTILIEKKIDSGIQEKVNAEVAKNGVPDFLLVVDFGYLVPNWLLELPRIAPLNIHPSQLPKWRGSSPGQFVLLYGEKTSAVTLMEMGAGLDTGPIIYQADFEVSPDWDQTAYYAHAFGIIAEILAAKIIEFAKTEKKMAQPTDSSTITARRLKKEDGFVEWSAINGGNTGNQLLLGVMQTSNQSLAQVIEQATRALSPWPGVWTLINTAKGEKRMQILAVHIEPGNKLALDQVKIEGQEKASWAQVKNQIVGK